MSVTAVAAKSENKNIDSLDGYDTELRNVWGPWIRQFGGDDAGLGFPRTNILHPKKGLSGPCDVEMSEEVKKLDRLIRGLPNEVMREVALQWYAYQGCVSKRALARSMTVWYERRGITKKVQCKDCDLWITGILMGIWYGLGCPTVE